MNKKLQIYQLAVIFSLLFSLLGFSYNVWRMEVTEHNSNVRTACFEMLLELAQLQQLVYAAHYDNDTELGNPRVGWVKVGLIEDLSTLANEQVKSEAGKLTVTWSEQWQNMNEIEASSIEIVGQIDEVRGQIKVLLVSLN
ncbi:hypothetical protein [Shewanella donghaensis]|uniref:hypothetical protein n=1 Tax=Shewanella donghaensis TaxID=238836 RepID=UPI001183A842|nr:hypothetical protein [Shewanella donghaensis]